MISPYLRQPAVRRQDLIPFVLIIQQKTYVGFSEERMQNNHERYSYGYLWENLNERDRAENVGV
jgi:hypothetical protein